MVIMGDKAYDQVVQLAEQLLEGFVALNVEYQQLFDQQRQLEGKLSWAKQQYLDALKRHTPSTVPQDHLVFLQELERTGIEPPRTQTEWIDQLSQSDDDDKRARAALIRQGEVAAVKFRNQTEENGVKIWSGPSADKQRPPLRIQPDMSHMEKDFTTTTGQPSKLGCPFASRSGRQSPLATPRSSTSRMSLSGRRSKRPSFTDPIRAEICGNDQASATASVDGSAAVCPIRFLDQHDPEEVAKYFEKHKHEIPRSHEVCITRFQSNTESIEQLDRKYGNLVSMIQGLGQKHQEYLPAEPEEDEEEPETEARTEQKVEKWAKAVTTSLQNLTPEESSPDNALDEARTAHFDRPMKEIRVGESPSRPWGISIPAKYTNAESSSSVGSAPTASPALPLETTPILEEEKPKQPSKCPFDHRALGMPPVMKSANVAGEHIPADHPVPIVEADPELESDPVPETEPVPAPAPANEQHQERQHDARPEQQKQEDSQTPKVVPQMVFNGPVFLGYPPEQLMTILQNSNLGAAFR